MAKIKIPGTEVKFDPTLVSYEVIDEYIKTSLESKYIEGVSWLAGVEDIISRNDPKVEQEMENIANLTKQRENVLANVEGFSNKIKFFQKLRDAVKETSN